MSIYVDGRVTVCCFDYDGKYVVGDLKKETLEEIWNNKKMRLIRRQFKKGKINENPLCKDCKEIGVYSFKVIDK